MRLPHFLDAPPSEAKKRLNRTHFLNRAHLASSAGRVGAAWAMATVGGVLSFCAFAPLGWWPVLPVGVALLLLAVRLLRPWLAAIAGLLWGLGFFLPLLHWSGIYVGWLPWVLLALSQAFWCAPYAAGLAWVNQCSRGLQPRWAGVVWMLSVSTGWVVMEALRSRLPWGGFSWGRLGFASADVSWLPVVHWAGVPALAAWVVLIAAVLSAAISSAIQLVTGRQDTDKHGTDKHGTDSQRNDKLVPSPPGKTQPQQALPGQAARGYGTGENWTARATALVLLGLAAALPFAPAALEAALNHLRAAPTPAGQATVALVQGNVPRLGLDFNAQRQQVLDNHVRVSKHLAQQVAAGQQPKPDVVIWPENSSDIDPFTNPSAATAINEAVAALGVPVVVGAVLSDGQARYNTSIVWGADGPGQRYIKRHPVPFAEYIPWRTLARRVSDKVDLVPVDFAAGQHTGLFTVAARDQSIPLGVLICFEISDDAMVRDVVAAGAGPVAVQTNNATFGLSPQSEQQLTITQVRAAQYQRPFLSASTSGISAVIGPDGQVIARSELFTPAVLVATVEWTKDQGMPTWVEPGLEQFAATVLAVAVLACAAAGRAQRHRPAQDLNEG